MPPDLTNLEMMKVVAVICGLGFGGFVAFACVVAGWLALGGK